MTESWQHPDDTAFGIYVGEHRMYGSPTIKCALNLWRFAKGIPWYHGNISIRDRNGAILYNFRKK